MSSNHITSQKPSTTDVPQNSDRAEEKLAVAGPPNPSIKPTIKSIEYFRVRPRWLFVKITTTPDNLVGWGEATLEGHSLAVEGTLDGMIPQLIGLPAGDIERIWQMLYSQGFYRGGPVFMSAISGIDIALWDLKGKSLGAPVYELLGGKVRDKVQVYAWIGGDNPTDVEAAARARKAQGFRAVKMNATGPINWLDSPSSLDSTIDRVRSVKALGMDVALDFHGRLHKPMAKQLAALLIPHRPLFIEEPLLPTSSPSAFHAISSTHASPIPIAAGERLYTRWDVLPYLEGPGGGSFDILQPDVAHAGGISETRRLAQLAEVHDVALAPHCPLGPIALAACVQVALCSVNFVIQEMSLGIHYNTESGARHGGVGSGDGDIDLLTYLLDPSVFDVRDGGHIDALTGPGLGIEIDEDLVRRVSQSTTEPWITPRFSGEDGGMREW